LTFWIFPLVSVFPKVALSQLKSYAQTDGEYVQERTVRGTQNSMSYNLRASAGYALPHALESKVNKASCCFARRKNN
jgi:hypothetical protein